jgi:nucleotidyltransferase substrate binding protein (TIGR01987 family)
MVYGWRDRQLNMNTPERIAEFQRAVQRLDEALQAGTDNSLFIDAAIQRFEFCVELAWKSLAKVLERDHAIMVASPKSAVQAAYQVGMIDDEPAWVAMLRDRNLTSHTYREALAREIHQRLPDHQHRLSLLVECLTHGHSSER